MGHEPRGDAVDETLPNHSETQSPGDVAPVAVGDVVGPPASAFGPTVSGHQAAVPMTPELSRQTPQGIAGEAATPAGGFSQDPPVEHSNKGTAPPTAHEPSPQNVGTIIEQGSPLPARSSKGIEGATVVSIAVVVAGLVVVAWMRGRMGGQMALRGIGAAPARADEPRRVANLPGHSPQIAAAASDLDQTAIALAALVREADVRIAELTRLRDELGMLGQDRERDTLAALVPGYIESGRSEDASPGARRAAQESCTGTNAHRARPLAAAVQQAAAPACADPMADRVYELADSGLSSVEIASALHEHTGKIELILALRRASVGG